MVEADGSGGIQIADMGTQNLMGHCPFGTPEEIGKYKNPGKYFNCSRSAALKYDLERFRRFDLVNLQVEVDDVTGETTYLPAIPSGSCVPIPAAGEMVPVYKTVAGIRFLE